MRTTGNHRYTNGPSGHDFSIGTLHGCVRHRPRVDLGRVELPCRSCFWYRLRGLSGLASRLTYYRGDRGSPAPSTTYSFLREKQETLPTFANERRRPRRIPTLLDPVVVAGPCCWMIRPHARPSVSGYESRLGKQLCQVGVEASHCSFDHSVDVLVTCGYTRIQVRCRLSTQVLICHTGRNPSGP